MGRIAHSGLWQQPRLPPPGEANGAHGDADQQEGGRLWHRAYRKAGDVRHEAPTVEVTGDHGAEESVAAERRPRSSAVNGVGEQVGVRSECRIELGEGEEDAEAVAARGEDVAIQGIGEEASGDQEVPEVDARVRVRPGWSVAGKKGDVRDRGRRRQIGSGE